jgi:hypothetical protein
VQAFCSSHRIGSTFDLRGPELAEMANVDR